MDPAKGGLGFLPGCPGCDAIINGAARSVTHNEPCRSRIVERAASDSSVAARVKVTRAREVEYHAKRLETDEEDKKRRKDAQVPPPDADMVNSGDVGASRSLLLVHSCASTRWNV